VNAEDASKGDDSEDEGTSSGSFPSLSDQDSSSSLVEGVRTEPPTPQTYSSQVTDAESEDSSSSDDGDGGTESSTGSFTEYFEGAARTFGKGRDVLTRMVDADLYKEERRVNSYYPFSSKAEWDVASWLASGDIPLTKQDTFFDLDYVSRFVNT